MSSNNGSKEPAECYFMSSPRKSLSVQDRHDFDNGPKIVLQNSDGGYSKPCKSKFWEKNLGELMKLNDYD